MLTCRCLRRRCMVVGLGSNHSCGSSSWSIFRSITVFGSFVEERSLQLVFMVHAFGAVPASRSCSLPDIAYVGLPGLCTGLSEIVNT